MPHTAFSAASRRGFRSRVLIVEDHPALRSVVRRVLREHDVKEAGNVEGALEVIRSTPVDLVLLDLRLPGTSGMELLRRLRAERHRQVPAVFVLTAVAEEASKVEALTLGAEDYLTKPFSFSELRLRVGNVLERRARMLALIEQIADLERKAFTDDLTGCGNRRAFDSALTLLWSEQRAEGGHVGLVLVDVDHLKEVNDSQGHAAGDRVLIAVARVLLDAGRAEERVYRLGGDEFAILLLADAREALRAAQRFHAEVTMASVPRGLAGGRVTVSAGVAAGPSPLVTSPEALVAAADRALYLAKRARNAVILSSSSLSRG